MRGVLEIYRSAYTSRNCCIHAILALRDIYVIWPDREKRKEIAACILKDYQLPNVVGIIEGTLPKLRIIPEADDKAAYSGKYILSLFLFLLSTMILVKPDASLIGSQALPTTIKIGRKQSSVLLSDTCLTTVHLSVVTLWSLYSKDRKINPYILTTKNSTGR